jgi:hypothetical protein
MTALGTRVARLQATRRVSTCHCRLCELITLAARRCTPAEAQEAAQHVPHSLEELVVAAERGRFARRRITIQ